MTFHDVMGRTGHKAVVKIDICLANAEVKSIIGAKYVSAVVNTFAYSGAASFCLLKL